MTFGLNKYKPHRAVIIVKMIAVVYSSVLIAVLFTPIESKPQEPIKVMNFSKVMQKLKKKDQTGLNSILSLHTSFERTIQQNK